MSLESSSCHRDVGSAREPGRARRWCRRTSPTRKRRATSARRSNQIAVIIRRLRLQRPHRRRQPRTRPCTCSASFAPKSSGACLCRPQRRTARSAADRLRNSGIGRNAGRVPSIADHGDAGAVDQSRIRSRRASPSSTPRSRWSQQLNVMTRGIQSLRANAETGLERCGQHRQQCDAADRQHQRADAARRSDRRRRRRAARSARRYVDQLSELMDIRVVTNERSARSTCSPTPACSSSAPRRRQLASMRRAP